MKKTTHLPHHLLTPQLIVLARLGRSNSSSTTLPLNHQTDLLLFLPLLNEPVHDDSIDLEIGKEEKRRVSSLSLVAYLLLPPPRSYLELDFKLTLGTSLLTILLQIFV